MFNNSKDKFMESILQKKINPFYQFAIGIEYGSDIPKLILDKDTQSMNNILNYEFKIYIDGNRYVCSKVKNGQNVIDIAVDMDFIYLIISIKHIIGSHITENMLDLIGKERADYREVINKIMCDYFNCCELLVSEPMIKYLAKKDGSLEKYCNFKNPNMNYIINNENRTFSSNFYKFGDGGKYTIKYYNEIIDDISYIVLMISSKFTSKHLIISQDIQSTKEDYSDKVKDFVLSVVDSDQLVSTIYKLFMTDINAIIKFNKKYPNITNINSINLSVILDRENKSIEIIEIGENGTRYFYDPKVSNFVDFIGHLIEELPLTTSLELFVATEAIREGRRILDNHLGIVETSTLHV